MSFNIRKIVEFEQERNYLKENLFGMLKENISVSDQIYWFL